MTKKEFSKKTELNIFTAFELVMRDHSCCDENSCNIGLAMQHGYDAIAILQWSGTGAACNDFLDLYAKLPKSYTKKEYKRQIDEFLKEIKSVECPYCNAYCRNKYETPDHCDCCGCSFKTLTKKTKVTKK